MEKISVTHELTCKKEYDIIVAGGGVAGVAAAITAKRRGKSVLLLEKSNILGGLATLGLVNFFVAMCNGRCKQIIFGLADEWIRLAGKYGYETISEHWRDGEPKEMITRRFTQRFSHYIFALQLTEMVKEEGIDLLFDCIASEPVMEGNHCKGIITESKSGREYYKAKMVIDVTGDADILRRSGMPTVSGRNFFSYFGFGITLESCKKAVETNNIMNAYTGGGFAGGTIGLYGTGQPEDVPLYSGLTVEDVSDYLIRNQTTLLDRLKKDDPTSRDLTTSPLMPQFRTTCHIDGDYTLTMDDVYKHFDDAICAINDFDHRDVLMEIPLRAITKKGFDNLLTAGRCVSSEGYAWDMTRVIPPAIITGQCAAETAVLAIDTNTPVAEVDIKTLQDRIASDNIMVHFPDEYLPEDTTHLEYAGDPNHK